MWLFNLLFSSLSQLWYVEVRISRSISLGIRDNESRLYYENTPIQIQYNLDGSNTDGSFTVDDSNSFLSP